MCNKQEANQLDAIVREAATRSGATLLTTVPPPPSPQGSRRRRLWELDDHAHCPVVGVCLPINVLRRTIDKVLGGQAVANDYDLHCGAIAECKLRTPLAEAVQRELDGRYMLALRQVSKIKTSEALAVWWQQAARGKDLAGALWAVLTHARCTPAIEHHVLGEVHMIQHQVGAAVRADLQRFEALIDENAILARELATVQGRTTRLAEEQARRSEQQHGQIVQLRAELIGRDTTIAALRDDLQTLEAAVPGLKSRVDLAREGERHIDRIHQLERLLLQSTHEAERQRRLAEEMTAELHRRDLDSSPVIDQSPDQEVSANLDDRAVLCVGGRQASVPIYRQLIERTGGRFLHHDGGEEDNVAKLDATLAAADLVICQTGCISHDAYWRVKDHCKRTGKRCVFVESPSTAGLKRALLTLVPIAAVTSDPGA